MTASSDLGPQIIIAFDIGLGLLAQGQRLWRIQWWAIDHLAVDQPVQQIQHMGFGRHALGQRKFYSDENGLFIVLKNQCEDVHHLAITAGLAQHMILQLSERVR